MHQHGVIEIKDVKKIWKKDGTTHYRRKRIITLLSKQIKGVKICQYQQEVYFYLEEKLGQIFHQKQLPKTITAQQKINSLNCKIFSKNQTIKAVKISTEELAEKLQWETEKVQNNLEKATTFIKELKRELKIQKQYRDDNSTISETTNLSPIQKKLLGSKLYTYTKDSTQIQQVTDAITTTLKQPEIQLQSKSTILKEERTIDKLKFLKEQNELNQQTVSISWDLTPGPDGQQVSI